MSGMEAFLFALVVICLPMSLYAAVKPRKQNMYGFSAAMWAFCAALNLPGHTPATQVIGSLQLIMSIGFIIGLIRSKHDPSAS